MKIIALEEHFAFPEIRTAWLHNQPELKAMQSDDTNRALDELGPARIQQMDAMGVDVQVLSLTTPATQTLPPDDAVRFARHSNDALAKTVAAFPTRFQGFATLPTTADPQQSASELTRCVEQLGFRAVMLHGRTGDRLLDHPDFFPILETAARLKVPIYIHPQMPSKAVREAYYDGFDPRLSMLLAAPGFGWHVETGIQALRLVLRGIFDRLPDLQIILGHWGETVLFYLERINMLSIATKGILQRPVADYFKTNFHLTPSGMFFPRMLRDSLELVGIDRVMFAVDYPYVSQSPGAPRRFLTESGLSEVDQHKIAHANWEQLIAPAG